MVNTDLNTWKWDGDRDGNRDGFQMGAETKMGPQRRHKGTLYSYRLV